MVDSKKLFDAIPPPNTKRMSKNQRKQANKEYLETKRVMSESMISQKESEETHRLSV